MSFEWKDSYSVKVGQIDRQHQKFFAMLNELNDAMRQGKSKDVLDGILAGLAGYTVTHFKTEEKYFDQFNYPKAVEHKKIHDDFVKKVTAVTEQVKANKTGVSIELMNFLTDWLIKHINGVDQKYSAFFNQHGLV
jgi:hemerythrin